MRIDLHTHSSRSDGTVSPRELVAHAAEVGVDVLALTDHDTTDGWEEAATTASGHGVSLIPGMELSCRFRGSAVHLLAYLFDPTYEPLREELGRILGGRDARLPQTIARLNAVGVAITEGDVRAAATEATALGRPHVADALVALGVVTGRDEAFARYLGPSGPAYVDRYAVDLEQGLALVAAAGGAAVIAHPWARRQRHRVLDEAALAHLASIGLAGVEVDHQDHDAAARERLRHVAADLDLVVTGASDFHGDGKVDHDLGCNLTAPEELDRLLARADDAARLAGRQVPQVVGR